MSTQREHWGSRIGFIMAAAGSAIGLGSLWRFPYTVGENGGGAFVILYIIFTILIGLPVFTAELVLGRNTQKSAVLAYQSLTKPGSNWKMLGWLNIISCFIILAYYSVVAGWCLCYTLMSLNQFSSGKSPEEIRMVFDTLYSSAGINLLWLALFMLLNVGVVYSGIRKGIEHWSKILTPGLLVILVLLFIYSCTLSGFGDAVKFLYYPNFAKISPSSILNALGMAFFTLSVGLGIILTYGSYMKPCEDIPRTSWIVAIMTLLVALIGAMMIFSIVFTFKFPPQAGPGLVFQTMPILFAQLPGSLVISTVFFALLLFTAITSSISLLEMLVANFMELKDISRLKATIIAAVIAFLIGIPCALSGTDALFPTWSKIYGKNFFDTMNYITASWMMPVAGLLTTLFVGWYMNKDQFKEELSRGSEDRHIIHIWYFSIKWLAPIATVLIILEQAGILNINTIITYIIK